MSTRTVYEVLQERPGEWLTARDVKRVLDGTENSISIVSIRRNLQSLKGLGYIESKIAWSYERKGQYGYFFKLK